MLAGAMVSFNVHTAYFALVFGTGLRAGMLESTY
jgi:hypothetical protein